MSNPYYNSGSFPSTGSPATSASMRAELGLVAAGFSKLPTLSGNADKLVVVNPSATGLTVIAAPTGDLVGTTATQTLTNKTINLGSNTMTGTLAQFNAALTDADFATLAGSETLTNKTLTNPVINGFTGSTAAINIGSGQLVKDTAGNLGLGVTPSAWSGGYKAIDVQFGAIANTNAGSVDVAVTQNAFFNGTNWITKYSGQSKRQVLSDAGFVWHLGASQTAGNAISFTQAMTLDASGRLLVGATSPSFGGDSQFSKTGNTFNLDVYAAGDATANNIAKVRLYNNQSNGAIGLAGSALVFYNANVDTERARIDSSGNLIQSAPTTPPSLATNGTMVFNLTSNTNLRVSVRGSDGVTRTANITLA